MTTYNTGNPLGSSAAKDLYDNAQNLDVALNSITQAIWSDRLGRNRRSYWGMEQAFSAQLLSQEVRFNIFIQNSGYEVIGDYEDGPLTITEYNQLIRYDGELWKITAATDIPFTTTGIDSTSWGVDSVHFVSVGDAALRQTLFGNDMVNLSPLYYGAKGDGLTDDTSAFTLLESETTGRVIDLGDKTYVVSAVPTLNNYLNGFFKVDTAIIKAGYSTITESAKDSRFSIKTACQNYTKRFDLTRSSGNGSGNVIQGFAVDTVNRFIYTQTDHAYGSFVDRFSLDSSVSQDSLGRTGFYYGIIGHQGLAIENKNDQKSVMWTSYSQLSAGNGRYLACSEFVLASAGQPSSYERWEMFPASYGDSSGTPSLSPDQKWLVAKNQGPVDTFIRIFDMEIIRKIRSESPTETVTESLTNSIGTVFTRVRNTYSALNKYSLEVAINSNELFAQYTGNRAGITEESLAIQSVVFDGEFLYFLIGYNTTAWDTYLKKYNLKGEVVEVHQINRLGLAESRAVAALNGITQPGTDIDGNPAVFHEPEALVLFPVSGGGVSINVSISTEPSGSRKCYIYELDGKNPRQYIGNGGVLVGNNQIDIKGVDGKVIFGNAGYEPFRMSYTRQRLVLNDPLDETYSTISNGNMRLQINSDIEGHGISTRRFSAGTGCSTYEFYKSRASTIWGTDGTALLSGDFLGIISAAGDDGNDKNKAIKGVVGAQMSFRLDSAASNGIMPTRIVWGTCDPTGSFADRWEIPSGGSIRPVTTNTVSVGSASRLPTVIYAASGTINTSDGTKKTPVRKLTSAEISVGLALADELGTYAWLDRIYEKESDARIHFGMTVQRAMEIFSEFGLSAFDYGAVCYDEWEEEILITQAVYNEEGVEISPYSEVITPAGNIYSFRPEEVHYLIVGALRANQKKIESRLAYLESK